MEPTHRRRGLSEVIKRDSAAKAAGLMLLATAVATVVMIVGRITAAADEPAFMGSLTAIASGSGEYALSGAARLVSGLTLLGAAWFLSRTWIIRRRLATPLVPGLFALSAVFTAVSGALAVALASMASQAVTLGAKSSAFARAETISDLRLLTGKIGFALAGLALVVAARYQWRVGGVLRYVAPVSAILGIAMQFIWINSATVAHPIIGTAFLVWLVGVGVMLLTGRTERLFTRYVDNRAAT
ncbi:MAG: hypothetical protein F4Z17_01415 [Acidimicrobiia bacterium]|nr:hypothetical protein [Acidimicrobiia bacterium]